MKAVIYHSGSEACYPLWSTESESMEVTTRRRWTFYNKLLCLWLIPMQWALNFFNELRQGQLQV